MAATNPSGDPDRTDVDYGRPRLSSTPATPAPRSPWLWVAIAVVVIAAIAVIAYFLLYSGGTTGYGSGGNGGGGGGGGGYFVLALTGDAIRRATKRLRR